ncbi:uncharacterized protein BDZ83DRAFT_72058 [Colletotrichum acutatum]|uniref:Uncharacterized protein n=1 Tax=Glomerella acutata TaxID=27357 RepID=A0AAD9D0G0_GLOAC|nr:uncharacterized protein BDZ83DRAFT_72058 [Colletotrichum acutatum]KAK1729191.1 hypothetical protein BDZ83DRAFT_72058 [Colletotrichum acutatum]
MFPCPVPPACSAFPSPRPPYDWQNGRANNAWRSCHTPFCLPKSRTPPDPVARARLLPTGQSPPRKTEGPTSCMVRCSDAASHWLMAQEWANPNSRPHAVAQKG